MNETKAGYIYVLIHPSSPNLYKIGVTIRHPKQRLAQHNKDFSKAAGRIVQQTGEKWVLKEFHAVPDPYWAEKAFWRTTTFPNIPYRYGVEVETMDWEAVQRGLEAAKKAGLRSEQPSTPLPDWVYAYTASTRKRLEGRDITLLGYVKSMRSGKANFQCKNGHGWRTTPAFVAEEGEGCPQCGIGKRSSEEITQAIGAGVICLLTHPNHPGLIAIGTPEEFGSGWETHRYRNVEDMVLGVTLIWELLGHPLPHDRKPIKIDLAVAEDAFRKLHYEIQEKIALEEKRKETLAD